MEWKRNKKNKRSHQNKKKKQQEQSTKNTNTTTFASGSPSPPFQFAPPTFAVDDAQKSTQQLIHETTQRVQQSGAVIFGMGGPLATTGMDSLASMSAALQWNVATTTTTTTTPSSNANSHRTLGWGDPSTTSNHTNNNPWAVLDEPDDEAPAVQPQHPFSFAPPSFAVTVPSPTEKEEELDPDL
uniref:Uncharacterized protein n=1 Tax=Amphora coffeiformis TaxID=265554 RepID=A0A7S3P4C8_9STRA